jgi:hypothetical protein
MSVQRPTIEKSHQVFTGDKIGIKPVAMKSHQATSHRHMARHVTDVMKPAANEDSLMNATEIQYFLKQLLCNEIQTILIRFEIKMGVNDGTMVPVPYWFDRLEISRRDGSKEIVKYYADTLMLMLASVTEKQSDAWAKFVNYDPATYQIGTPQLAGTTRYYYLPLVANVFEGFGLDLNNIDSDIEMKFFPKSGGPLHGAVSVGAVPILKGVAGILLDHEPDIISTNASTMFLHKNVKVHNYLDTQIHTVPSEILAPSSSYEYTLDQFNHLSAALVLHIQPVANGNSTGTSGVYTSLEDGTIDILGTTGNSEYGKGRAVLADYLKDILVQQHFGTDYISVNNVYVIPFGDFGKALHGIIDGVQVFAGTTERLKFTTPSTFTPGTYRIKIYSLYFRTLTQNGQTLSVAKSM